jgi:hypothetical protein
MRSLVTISALAIVMLVVAVPVHAQAPRQDVLWARRTSTPPVLDGKLTEFAWTKAESVHVHFRIQNGIPGSGWKIESGYLPSDSTDATLKFLTCGDSLYMAAIVHDKSIGGSSQFNFFDGFLMSIKDHSSANAPKPPTEYMYSWWYGDSTDPQPPGELPVFWGYWETWPPGSVPRTPAQKAAWDGATVVHGISNDDAVPDTSYVVELRFNVGLLGYHITQSQGDAIEFNISIYDCDNNWPYDMYHITAYRSWWQGPWGNAMWYDEVRMLARPNVTIDSGTLPSVGPEVTIPSGDDHPAPTIDGVLSEPIWSQMQGFDIRYDDDALRATYPGVGKYRSGQWQPAVNDTTIPVVDPADATVKMFVKGDNLYLGFDVRDAVLIDNTDPDLWDGVYVLINDVAQQFEDHNLLGRNLSFHVAQNGTAIPADFLQTLVDSGKAEVALTLKPGSTVGTPTNPQDIPADAGYTAEMRVDLKGLSYPAGLGDRTLFIGINILDSDYDSFTGDGYADHAWWFRERENLCCPAWAYMNPTAYVGVGDESPPTPKALLISSAEPNPFLAQTTIAYTLGVAGQMKLEVYDIQGRLVERRGLGLKEPGSYSASFNAEGLAAGVYHYRLVVTDLKTGAVTSSAYGRFVHLK